MKKDQLDFIEKVSSILRSVYHVHDEVADFIGCQFALESSFGRSSLAVNHHNYCGMKCPLVRVSVANNYQNPVDKWADYSSLEQCICDYMFCLAYRRPLSLSFETINHFIYFIKGWYCPEKSYTDKINSLYVQLKSYKNGRN